MIDNLLERTHKVLAFEKAKNRDVTNLQEWIETFGCISREETKYLWKADLMALGPSDPDELLSTIGNFVEDCFVWISTLLKKVRLFSTAQRVIQPRESLQ